MHILRKDGNIFFSSKYVDVVWLKANKIVQLGRGKNKFILISPNSNYPTPHVLSRKHWKTKKRFGRLSIGETTRPLKISKIMGDMYEAFRKKGNLSGQGKCTTSDGRELRGRGHLLQPLRIAPRGDEVHRESVQ